VARPRTIRSFIDELPEVQRREVVDALLAGKSLRQVGKIAGCSHSVIQDYKRRTLLPALRQAQEVQAFQPLPPTNREALQQQARLTKDIIQASPFKDRLEKLWDRTDKALDRAESAVRVVLDEDTGKLVAVGPDVSAIAPLLNQAHKNVELLGRVTGELEVAAGSNIAIQIVLPQVASPPSGAESAPAYEVIDIAPPKR
jgi:hypothetical protein